MDLDSAKKRLVEALKDKTQRYWDLLKSWYKRKISKDDLDSKSRSLLGEGNVHLHNEFLFAILVKCQTGAHPAGSEPSAGPPHLQYSIPGKPRTKKQKLGPPAETIPYGALDTLQYHTPPKVQVVSRDLDSLLLCSHELLLPNLSTLHTRMLLGAWEAGLEGVSEEAARLLMFALEYHLKSVIQTLIAHHTSWRLRQGQFQHSFGRGLASRALPSSATSSSVSERQVGVYPVDAAEAKAAMMAAHGTQVGKMEPLTLFNLRDALQVNRHCIPVHSLYSCTMERVLAGLWHPSREEEKQQGVVEEWQDGLRPRMPFTITTIHR